MSSLPRIYISAAHKSSGKTTLSIGLCAALAERGSKIFPFKKGPDYIDPMWLARAAGRPCYNLDFNVQTLSEIKGLFSAKTERDGIAVIEGNKGLYDGVDVQGEDSNAALARHLNTPVVLVLDVTGITRGAAPLILGYQAFDTRVRISGVVLNKVGGPRVESKLRAVLEHYTDIPVLGAVGRDKRLEVRERHLGLTPPSEAGKVDEIIERLRVKATDSIDLERIRKIAREAPGLEFDEERHRHIGAGAKVRIGVARDRAFGFYYADDLEMLESQGAELIYFDTISAPALPDVDGLFIGGGFPETHMEELEANKSLRADIAAKAEAGLPIYAECGGLMYLTRSISWNGRKFDMVGAIEADTIMHDRPQGRGLVVLEETGDHPWASGNGLGAGSRIAAHEFHYAGLNNIDKEYPFAYRVNRGAGIDGAHDGIVHRNILASFAHLRDSSQCSWARRFVRFVQQRK